jgi:cell division septal protein FtsQ
MARNSSILSPKYVKKKRRILIGRVLASCILFIIIVGIASYVSMLPSMRIESVEVFGNGVIARDQITTIVHELTTGNYLFLFPKDSVFLYPRRQLEEAMGKAFPRSESVAVETKDWNTLSVTLVERKPHALWCENHTSDAHCYFLDENGYVFGESPAFSGTVFFRYEGLLSENPIEKSYLDREEFKRLDAFVESVRKSDIPVVSLAAHGQGEFEFEIKNQSNETGSILFNYQTPYEQILSNLLAVWKEKKNLSYIDLRYGNKVYFKVR